MPDGIIPAVSSLLHRFRPQAASIREVSQADLAEREASIYVGITLAEYFRDQGANVLLLMDSLTRFGQAQREISLAIGEPPATKGYPPSVFARIPELVERAGNAAEGGGSITAFYTVLTEGDDLQEPSGAPGARGAGSAARSPAPSDPRQRRGPQRVRAVAALTRR